MLSDQVQDPGHKTHWQHTIKNISKNVEIDDLAVMVIPTVLLTEHYLLLVPEYFKCYHAAGCLKTTYSNVCPTLATWLYHRKFDRFDWLFL